MKNIETTGLYEACTKVYELGLEGYRLLEYSVGSHGVDVMVTQPVSTDSSVWFSSTRLQLLSVLNEYGLSKAQVDLQQLKLTMSERQTEFAMYAAPVWFFVEKVEEQTLEEQTLDVSLSFDQGYVDSIRPTHNTDKEARSSLEEYGKTLGVNLDKRQGFSKMEKALKDSLGVQ